MPNATTLIFGSCALLISVFPWYWMVRSFDEEGLRFIVGVSAFSFSSHRASLTLSFYDWKKKSTGIFACNNNPNLPLFSSLSSSSSSSSKSPSNALVLRRVHRCSNATEALHILLDSIETKHFDNDSARKFDYESLVLDTYKRRALSKVLQMLGNDGQWETVLEYYRKVLFSFTYNELGDDFPSDSLMDITKCAISSLGASKQTNQAVALLHFYLEHFEASEKKAMSINNKLLLIYSTISSCRSSGDWEIALKLFHESEQVISTDTKDSKYQQQHGFRGDLTHNRISGLEVTLTVLAHQKRYQEAIGLLDGLFLKNVTSKLDQSRMLSRPNSSRVYVQLCNLALQACSKALNHTAALRILDRMLQYNRAYHHSNRKEKIQNNSSSSMLLQSFYSAPNIESFEIVISACGKCGAWSDAMLVQNIMNSNEESWPRSLLKALDTSQNGSRSIENKYNWHFQGLPKSGSGKHAWWEIARFKFHAGPNLRIGISPNRNRRRYGFRLQFFSVETGEKIGFMLIKCPTTTDKVLTSSLVGMRVSDSFRNQGLSSLFMAIWLRICGDTKMMPRAEKINKPLLSLVLTKFGFDPLGCGGIELELSPIENNVLMELRRKRETGNPVVLHSPGKRKSLEGVFTSSELKRQNLIISNEPPHPQGSITFIKTEFYCPDTERSILKADEVIRKHGYFNYSGDMVCIRYALFGK